MFSRRNFILSTTLCLALPRFGAASAQLLPTEAWAQKLIAAATSQIGITTGYDPAYRRIDYPGGDVERGVGVCTDVIIRAFRDGLDVDLQKLVHMDMKRAFGAYPKNWGLRSTDRNIDHRRVPNLQAFFDRKGAKLPTGSSGSDFRPGDIVTQIVPVGLPHIALVSNTTNNDGSRPLVIHNIGRGTRMEDTLFTYDITGHYRFSG